MSGSDKRLTEWIKKTIPPRYINAEINGEIKLDVSKSWYLAGDVGTGKTHFSYAIVKKQILRSKELKEPPWYPHATMTNMAEFAGRLRSELYEDRSEFIKRIQKAKRLILDDMGSESQSDFSNDVLFQILNYRYEQMLWTGFTSNFKIGELPYESRIVSRIAGMVENNSHMIVGSDLRIKSPKSPK